ncbi:MAG: cytochrome c oxidase subunit II, partial [Limisphaerales bacterium]
MHIVPVLQPGSPQAQVIAHLFRAILIACGVIMAVVTGAIVYSLMHFRSRPGAPEPPQILGSKPLEILWTVVPILVVVWMFMLTARASRESDPTPAVLDPDLRVIGHQWWWEALYPKSSAVTANEIHIPTGQRLLVQVDSADVIHDFWVPELGRKMDMIPGHPNYIWLEATQPGTYRGACAEYCGAQHAWMRIMVVADPPVAFDSWVRHQAQPAPNTVSKHAEGAALFQQLTCANCHAIRGSSATNQFAPDLTHLAERRTLAAGVLSNTLPNLVEWLRSPQTLKPGCLMPNLQLTPTQASALADYLESLK